MTQLKLPGTNPHTRDRVRWLEDIAEKMGHNVTSAPGYAEPDCDDEPVVLANWNNRMERNPEAGEQRITDDTMSRLAVLFEKLGYAVEWEDEWTACSECCRAVRTQGDSYSWRQYYWLDEANCEIICGDCIKGDPGDYLEHLSGNHECCDTIGLDLTKHGYTLQGGDYEAGWYNRNDDPGEIAKELQKDGIEDFIFQLDSQKQFATGFSVWAKGALPCLCQ